MSTLDFTIATREPFHEEFLLLARSLSAMINGPDDSVEGGYSTGWSVATEDEREARDGRPFDKYQLGGNNDFWLHQIGERSYRLSARYARLHDLRKVLEVLRWRLGRAGGSGGWRLQISDDVS